MNAHIFDDFRVKNHLTNTVPFSAQSTQLLMKFVVATFTEQRYFLKEYLPVNLYILILLLLQDVLDHGCTDFFYLQGCLRQYLNHHKEWLFRWVGVEVVNDSVFVFEGVVVFCLCFVYCHLEFV